MINNIQDSFDSLINDEAIRIMGRMLIMYEKRKKVNKSFEDVIRDLAKKDYKSFWIDIMVIIHKLLPECLWEDFSGKYVLVTKEDYRNQTLKNYYKNHCKNKNGKDHKESSKQIANILIKHCTAHPTCKEDLLQLMVINMSKIMPEHNDSVDIKTIVMYIQQDINDFGYIITNLSPLRIKKSKLYKDN
ncbi:MAG: hypothetical protein PHX04_05250 [Bacilli bacterium]|nr:hypothetical protein [Bacilli bacterium]